jgi:prepilin-type N-terminal cleavage/methylation domain-containing protein
VAQKNHKGFTLVEMILTVSILVVVTAVVGAAVMDSFRSFSANKKLEDDQYNARMALLAITREAHKEYNRVTFANDDDTSGTLLRLRNIDQPVDGDDISTDDERTQDEVTFALVNGWLRRTTLKADGAVMNEINDYAEIQSVTFEKVPYTSPNGTQEPGPLNWLRIKIICNGADNTGGLELSTTISLSRILPN